MDSIISTRLPRASGARAFSAVVTAIATAAITLVTVAPSFAQTTPIPVPAAPPQSSGGLPPQGVAPNRQLVPVGQLTAPQIQSLVAGVALYQDGLLSMMFLASGFPGDLEQAQLMQSSLAGLSPEQAAETIRVQNWDPSVKSLLSFPAVLTMMATQADWTRQIGDLYRFRSADLMQAVQALRQQALQSGQLKSTSQIQVIVDSQGQISINPVNPQQVFIPQYNPTVVYGRWLYPNYPPYPIYSPAWGGLVFGAAIAAGAVIWAAPVWRRGVVVVNQIAYNGFVGRYGYPGGGRPWAGAHFAGGHHRR